MNYEETLAYLDNVCGLGVKLGLDAVTRLLEGMGNPHRDYPAVVVAGTNGKGSVCAFLSNILVESGLRTGLFTSPHLVRYEERIAVDGAPVTPEDFAAALSETRGTIDALMADGLLKAHPTHFEILTVSAFHHFRRMKVDIAVMEIGMGGRLDAVSVASAPVGVITSIGLEHTRFLGNSIAEIAAEKGAIARRGCTLVSGVKDDKAAAVIRRTSAEAGAHLIESSRVLEIGVGEDPSSFALTTPTRHYRKLTASLAGEHQVDNASLAVLAAESLDTSLSGHIDADAISRGLAGARWPGRLQQVGADPLLILDGAHNPAASRVLARALGSLRDQGRYRKLHLILGVLKEKDLAGIVQPLLDLDPSVTVTRGTSERFIDPRDLKTSLESLGCHSRTAENPLTAIEQARSRAAREDAIVLCGSLYLVGDALKAMEKEPFSQEEPAQ